MEITKLFFILFISTISFCGFATDSWLCTETASKQVGSNEFVICGTSTAPTEADARNRSFENAINEFRGFCQRSANCRTREANFAPRRTSCKLIQNEYICHRAVQVTLGSKLKSLTMSDAELEREINLRRKRVRDEQERTQKLKKLRALENQMKRTDTRASELESAETDLYEAKYRALSFEPLLFKRGGFGVSRGPLEEIGLTSFTLNGGAEYLLKPYLRFNGILGYVSGFSNEKLGQSNSEVYEHELKGVEGFITVGYSFAPYWIDLGIGYLSGSYAQNGYEKTNLGTNTSKVIQLRKLSLGLPFISAQIEYEREIIFFTVEYRKYQSSNSDIKVGSELRLYIGGKW